MYLFPYNLVLKGSNIALYGFGDVGKDFYIQMHLSGYCNLVVWVDQIFESYKVSKPFDYVENIVKYSFDYVVIAVADYSVANQIRNNLINQGIKGECIIWSFNYSSVRDFFPSDKTILLDDFNFFRELFDKAMELNDAYFKNDFYQDYNEIGISGKRSNDSRINLYKIDELLDKSCEVLNIGCNTGFFDLKIAPKVKHVIGIDIEKKYIDIANFVKAKTQIKNVDFYCADAFKNWNWRKYDAIFLLAVHKYIIMSGVSQEKFIDVICDGLKEQGYVFFESLHLKTGADNIDYFEICEKFEERGLKKISFRNINSYGNRNIAIFKRG